MWELSQKKAIGERHSIDPVFFRSREVTIDSFIRDDEPRQSTSRGTSRPINAAALHNFFMQYMNNGNGQEDDEEDEEGEGEDEYEDYEEEEVDEEEWVTEEEYEEEPDDDM